MGTAQRPQSTGFPEAKTPPLTRYLSLDISHASNIPLSVHSERYSFLRLKADKGSLANSDGVNDQRDSDEQARDTCTGTGQIAS